ncbi:hypothetical protein JTB14_012503 [Gonioctena quinquepunctata]|nr:hypothetical protein JTB14_012503 [Gonioctena quinquepunctata]
MDEINQEITRAINKRTAENAELLSELYATIPARANVPLQDVALASIEEVKRHWTKVFTSQREKELEECRRNIKKYSKLNDEAIEMITASEESDRHRREFPTPQEAQQNEFKSPKRTTKLGKLKQRNPKNETVKTSNKYSTLSNEEEVNIDKREAAKGGKTVRPPPSNTARKQSKQNNAMPAIIVQGMLQISPAIAENWAKMLELEDPLLWKYNANTTVIYTLAQTVAKESTRFVDAPILQSNHWTDKKGPARELPRGNQEPPQEHRREDRNQNQPDRTQQRCDSVFWIVFYLWEQLSLKTRKSNMEKLTEAAILEELCCPVCDHYMYPPIFLCNKGHSICEECFKKVKICPKCRGPKNHAARNFALEAIHAKLNIPCKNALSGCDVILSGEHIRKHQSFCFYTSMFCPFKYYDNCQWKQHRGKLKSHLLKKHSLNFYIREKQKFLSQHFPAIENYHYIYAVIHAHSQFFRLTWDINETTGMTRWAVYFIGHPEAAKNYSFKLEFSKVQSDDGVISAPLTFKSVCEKKPEEDNVKFVDHNCFYIHRSLLNNYCSAGGELNYKVTIYNLKKEYISDIGLLFKEFKLKDDQSDQSE